jgi:DNA invertase Pin-like site-specific DNA recombinase
VAPGERRSLAQAGELVRAFGYVRVSTEDQGSHGVSLEAQADRLAAEAARRGWEIEINAETASAKALEGRPVLNDLLSRLADGQAGVLMVAKLDRLARSVFDFSDILRRAERAGWQLVMLDPDVDTSTPMGRVVAQVIAVFAEFEREMISQRTKEGLAKRKAQGVHTGRFAQPLPENLLNQMQLLRRRVRTCADVAEELNRAEIWNPRTGGAWSRSAVERALRLAETGGSQGPSARMVMEGRGPGV